MLYNNLDNIKLYEQKVSKMNIKDLKINKLNIYNEINIKKNYEY